MAKSERKQVLEDTAWWRSMLPTGWQLYGFDFRRAATFVAPDGRLVDIDAELLLAILKPTI